ncbi:MAG: DUF420 domain-containing protein [Nitrospiria bacterium]
MKKFLNAPGFLSPYGTFGADFSSVMAWFFTILFIYGWYVGRKHQGQRHHQVTLYGMVAMLGYFTIYYLARGLGALSAEGKEGFGGPDWVYNSIFIPILLVHLIAVSIGLVLAVYMIILGYRSSAMKNQIRFLKAETLKIAPKTFKYIMIGSAATFGLLALLRSQSWQRSIVWIAAFVIIASVMFLERGIERWIPDGGKRHRKIGTLTMVLYVIALVTSTATYVMLYYIYPVAETAA